MPPVLPVDFISNESVFKKNIFDQYRHLSYQLRKTIKELKLVDPIITKPLCMVCQ
jgi:hypothetical protein